MLQAAELAAVRGDRRLFAGLSFALEAGALLHVKGPNGSGKTTLLRMLCGLTAPAAGAVSWEGQDIRALGEAYRAELIYLGHQSALKDELNGLENLTINCRLAGVDLAEDRALEALSRMGLQGLEELPSKVLSQGQKRRVALARLLVSRARLWVLDEPFTALDTGAVALLQSVIEDHLARRGLVVLTTHQAVALSAPALHDIRLGA